MQRNFGVGPVQKLHHRTRFRISITRALCPAARSLLRSISSPIPLATHGSFSILLAIHQSGTHSSTSALGSDVARSLILPARPQSDLDLYTHVPHRAPNLGHCDLAINQQSTLSTCYYSSSLPSSLTTYRIAVQLA